MDDLRVELQAVNSSSGMTHRRNPAFPCGGEDLEVFRQAHYMVAMAHPDPMLASHAVEQAGGGMNPEGGASKFVRLSALDPAAEILGEQLMPVADA